VKALLHRNTRDTLEKYNEAGVLDESVANRNPERKDISLSDEAAEVYERIDEYTTKFYKKAQESEDQQTKALGFVMTTYRERLTSSIAAIRNSLSRRLKNLNNSIERSNGRLQSGKISIPRQQLAWRSFRQPSKLILPN